jgi:hypothetical protein
LDCPRKCGPERAARDLRSLVTALDPCLGIGEWSRAKIDLKLAGILKKSHF